MTTPTTLADRVEAPLTGMATIMLIEEHREGRTPIWPHNAPEWLVRSDWRIWPVLAIEGDELHIIAIASTRPGAFRDLLAGIDRAGLKPVVVCPIGPIMPALMRRWKWKRTVRGHARDRREEWRPAQALRARQTSGL